MILGYKKIFPWGGPTNFKPKILSGKKKHSLRQDKNNRWKTGRKIQHAHGVRTKQYDHFADGECKSTQEIEILVSDKQIKDSYPIYFNKNEMIYFIIKIDTQILTLQKIKILAENDGFDCVYDFFQWFKKGFSGKIIHFTDLKH